MTASTLNAVNIPDLIRKKRDGETHTKQELETLVLGYTRGDVPDYQMSAWLMAVFLRGMAEQETADLTMVMAESGDLMNLGDLPVPWISTPRAAWATRPA